MEQLANSDEEDEGSHKPEEEVQEEEDNLSDIFPCKNFFQETSILSGS